jgi:hypothetical protein
MTDNQKTALLERGINFTQNLSVCLILLGAFFEGKGHLILPGILLLIVSFGLAWKKDKSKCE